MALHVEQTVQNARFDSWSRRFFPHQKLRFFCIVPSPRYRIQQRPSVVRPWQPVFDVQRRVLWWWEDCGTCFLSFEEALAHLEDLDSAPPDVERMVVYEKYSPQ